MQPNLRLPWLVLILSFTCITWASEDNQPSMEFLEFLGEWETDDGEWIDPQALETLEAERQAEEASNNE